MTKFAGKGFWSGWAAGVGLTALLFAWHLDFSPFTCPGARANEAAAIFLMAMSLRWAILASLVVSAIRRREFGRQRSAPARIGRVAGGLGLHLLLGLANLGVWDAWLSVGDYHTRAVDACLAAAYFLIPIGELLALGAMRRSARSE